MKTLKCLGLSAILLMGAPSWAANVKVGLVDMQKALVTVNAGKRAKKKLDKEVSSKRASLEKAQQKLQKEAQAFEKKAALMNDSARSARQQELQRKFLELQKQMQESQVNLQKRERDLTQPIIKQLRAILQGMGKSKKFDLILEKNEGAVLFAQGATDLTGTLISTYNKKHK